MLAQSSFIAIFLFTIINCNPPKKSETSDSKDKTSTHNSQNSLDWTGIYAGVLPCADCEGIQTEIRLNEDLTYHVTSKYSGKNDDTYRSKGRLKWDETGNKIILEKTEGQNIVAEQYQVGENILTALDSKGDKIQSTHPEAYLLKKVSFDNIITEKYWKLIELNGKEFVLKGNEKKEPHFILKNEDNKVTGFGGCNSFIGGYELSAGNKIKFLKMISTMMACLNVDYEKDYLKVFDVVDNYTFKGDTLSLNKARMAPLAKFAAVYLR